MAAKFIPQGRQQAVRKGVSRGWESVAGSTTWNNNLGSGKTGPSIEEIFTPDQAPGLGDSPDYLAARAFVQVDTRDVSGDFAGTSARVTRAAPRIRSLTPSYATRGGFARVDFAKFSATSELLYDFDLVDTAAGYLIPILRDNWVLALRAQATFTRTNADHEVPYFLLPALGSSRDLRGFDNFRLSRPQQAAQSGRVATIDASEICTRSSAPAGAVGSMWARASRFRSL